MIENLVLWVTVYAALGAAFAVLFAWKGAARIDPSAAGASWGFRLLILPGAAAFWPWLLLRWSRAARDEEGEA
ncbi:MAG: hypothetical protein ACR2QM_00435 [Longimicrobiales bacterium]